MKCVKPLHIRASYHKATRVISYIPIVQCVKCDCTNTFYFVFWLVFQRAISLKIIPLTRLYSRPFDAICTDYASKKDQKEYSVKTQDIGSFVKDSYFGQNFVSKLVTWKNLRIALFRLKIFKSLSHLRNGPFLIFHMTSFFRLLTKQKLFRMCNFKIFRNAIRKVPTPSHRMSYLTKY